MDGGTDAGTEPRGPAQLEIAFLPFELGSPSDLAAVVALSGRIESAAGSCAAADASPSIIELRRLAGGLLQKMDVPWASLPEGWACEADAAGAPKAGARTLLPSLRRGSGLSHASHDSTRHCPPRTLTACCALLCTHQPSLTPDPGAPLWRSTLDPAVVTRTKPTESARRLQERKRSKRVKRALGAEAHLTARMRRRGIAQGSLQPTPSRRGSTSLRVTQQERSEAGKGSLARANAAHAERLRLRAEKEAAAKEAAEKAASEQAATSEQAAGGSAIGAVEGHTPANAEMRAETAEAAKAKAAEATALKQANLRSDQPCAPRLMTG